MKTNKVVASTPVPRTAQGAMASRINLEQQLARSVATSLLWEDIAFEDGVSVVDRVKSLVPRIAPEKVAALAVKARNEQKLRHMPLLLVRELARTGKANDYIANTLFNVINRADELSEFLALYWKDGKQPLSNQVKKGLARAFAKFDAYQLAKYNADTEIKLRDVLFLSHAKPQNDEQAKLWKQLVDGTLPTPDTWEVALSASNGANKKAIWTRLIEEGKLGAMAFMRNLRNMREAGVDINIIRKGLLKVNPERVLPFRFVSAAQHNPQFEGELEQLMMKCLSQQTKLSGKTVFVIDLSGSMNAALSAKSELTRKDTACALAMLIREVAENPVIYATAGRSYTHATDIVPARHGFALRDAIRAMNSKLGNDGIYLTAAMDYIYSQEKEADRVIVISDEQDCARDDKNPQKANAFGKHNYIVNISTNANGIAYSKFTHINGWSESVIDFIRTIEEL